MKSILRSLYLLLLLAPLCPAQEILPATSSQSGIQVERAPAIANPQPKPHFESRPLLIAHASAIFYDGWATHYSQTHCPGCTEHDPLTRLMIGRRPTWKSMAPWGLAEFLAPELLPRKWRKPVRVVLSVAHFSAGTSNWFTASRRH